MHFCGESRETRQRHRTEPDSVRWQWPWVAGELLERLDVEFLCAFEVGAAHGGRVACRIFARAGGARGAGEVASLYGGKGDERQAAFDVPNLDAFQKLWAAEDPR